jgi:hypothetical protein
VRKEVIDHLRQQQLPQNAEKYRTAPISTPTTPPDKAGEGYETCDSASDYNSEVVMDFFAYSLVIDAVVVIVEAR